MLSQNTALLFLHSPHCPARIIDWHSKLKRQKLTTGLPKEESRDSVSYGKVCNISPRSLNQASSFMATCEG